MLARSGGRAQASNPKGGTLAVEITMKELLEAGVHFGHQTRRWNPKMKEYIFGERNGIHIIDLQKTLKMFREAARFVSELSGQGKTILLIGTKRQAQEAIAEETAVREARRMGVPVVSVVDTNCNPDLVDWVIPGNDDALRAIRLFTSKISDAILEGRNAFEQTQIAEEKAAEEGAEVAEVVEYVDTSAYEAYEKQEGDFVEGETPAEPVGPAEEEEKR